MGSLALTEIKGEAEQMEDVLVALVSLLELIKRGVNKIRL